MSREPSLVGTGFGRLLSGQQEREDVERILAGWRERQKRQRSVGTRTLGKEFGL